MGLSTGLNHHNRWTIEKAAAGSYPLAVGDIMPSGNVANAQAVARRLAHDVSHSFYIMLPKTRIYRLYSIDLL